MNVFFRHATPSRNLWAVGLVAGLIAASLAITLGCQGGPNVFSRMNEARELTAEMRVEFNKAAQASNSAVMADTDQASIQFARDAQQRSTLVAHDLAQLQKLLHALAFASEIQMLEQFKKQFDDYSAVDHAILELAVENTNLKAQALSFGPAREAADRFVSELVALSTDLAPNQHSQGEGLVFKAVVAIRELQTLEAPHIASSDDAAMTEMEKKMTSLEARAIEALTALSGIVPPNRLAAAHAAFADYKKIHTQMLALSRHNSNVRSLDLALRVKPSLTVACDDSLSKLQQALAKEGIFGTR